MPLHHPSLLAAPRRIDTGIFFAEIVPGALRARREAARLFGFSLVIEIEGVNTWSIDFANAVARLRQNVDGTMDALVTIRAADFEALIAGRLDVEAAWREGKVLVAGDLRAIEALTIILG